MRGGIGVGGVPSYWGLLEGEFPVAGGYWCGVMGTGTGGGGVAPGSSAQRGEGAPPAPPVAMETVTHPHTPFYCLLPAFVQ